MREMCGSDLSLNAGQKYHTCRHREGSGEGGQWPLAARTVGTVAVRLIRAPHVDHPKPREQEEATHHHPARKAPYELVTVRCETWRMRGVDFSPE